jgi:glucosamine-6-phosphate deaminase
MMAFLPLTFRPIPNTTFVLDEAAASALTRIKTPWLVDACTWDKALIKKAVIWLSTKLQKPILKLTNRDYAEYGMGDIITESGNAYKINIEVFNELQHTITGWPGGKPNADDTHRP